jgi:DNA adenine methylase
MTRENVLRLREENPKDDQSVAFRTLVLNRTSRGGNIYTGSLVRSGESGRGISSRWYPDTLVFRIRRINHLASSGVLTFQQCDVFPMLSSYDFSDTVLFLDPPYTSEGTSAGHRLYAHAALDHAHLLQKFATFSGAAFATHENTHTILELARCHGLLVREVEMKTTHHLKKKEIVLFNRALGKQIA